MSGHASRPWSLNEHISKEYGNPSLCSHAVMGADGLQIATVVSDCVREFEENALLIAAAPDLLWALKSAREWHRGDKWRGTEKHNAWQAQADLLDAAIAKATGAQA